MPKQDLKDILGKSGDFQFSFSLKDLVSPALDKIDKASQVLTKFFDKESKKVSDKAARTHKWVKSVFHKDMKDTDKSIKKGFARLSQVEDSLDGVYKRAYEAQKPVKGLLEEIRENTDFTDIKMALSSFSEELEIEKAVNDYLRDMKKLGDGLGRGRKTMVGMTTAIAENISQYSSFAASADDARTAMLSLFAAGVRTEKMFVDLTPKVVLASKVLGKDVGSVSAAYYELNNRIGLSGKQISSVFLSWKKTSEKAAVSIEALFDTMTDKDFYTNYRLLTRGLATDTQTNMLKSLGHIQGAFEDSWAGGTEFVKKLVEYVADPAKAGELANLTGMTAAEVKKALQTNEGATKFIDEVVDYLRAQGESAGDNIPGMAEMLGMETGDLLEIMDKGENIKSMMRELQKGGGALGDTMDEYTKKVLLNMGVNERWSNAISNFFFEKMPLFGKKGIAVLSSAMDLPLEKMASLWFILGKVGVSSAFATKAVGLFGVALPAAAAKGATLATVFTTLGGAALGAVAPFLILAAKAAVVVGILYLVYTYFDDIKKVTGQVYDFLLGSGPLEKGWLGTLQGIVRFLLVPVKVLVGLLGLLWKVVKAVGKAVIWMVDKWFQLTGVYELVDKAKEHLSGLWDWIQTTFASKGASFGEVLKGAFTKAINYGIVDPINAKINTPVGLGVTMGDLLNLQEVPRLGKGGAVMGPTLAQIGEVRPEVVVDLDQYDRLRSAAQSVGVTRKASASAPIPARMDQDKVVAAIIDLKRTIMEGLRRRSLPTEGSGFSFSPASASMRDI